MKFTFKILQKLKKQESWIIEGAYNEILDPHYIEADITVFLDLARHLYFYRSMKRAILSPERTFAPGCPRRISWRFIKLVWSYPTVDRLRALEYIEQQRQDGKRVVIITNPAEIISFVNNINSGT